MGKGTGGPPRWFYSAVLMWPGAGSVEWTPSTFTLENELGEAGQYVTYPHLCPFCPVECLAARCTKSCLLNSESRIPAVGFRYWKRIGWLSTSLHPSRHAVWLEPGPRVALQGGSVCYLLSCSLPSGETRWGPGSSHCPQKRKSSDSWLEAPTVFSL